MRFSYIIEIVTSVLFIIDKGEDEIFEKQII